ncbi:hypothetical protein DKZ56_01140 [Ureibacillus thermophilus]|uniref:Uncharacterized protein n=1 Tax=Ureibacillus thermophilus TaxID=367743 RepID=A0A4V1A2R1_9BACL|nr:hypothetical protein DKZ56_01140 [Ureibacillus thermophilus]
MMNTENVVPHLRKEAVNPVGDLLEGGVTTGIKRTAIHGRRITMLLNQILSRENNVINLTLHLMENNI